MLTKPFCQKLSKQRHMVTNNHEGSYEVAPPLGPKGPGIRQPSARPRSGFTPSSHSDLPPPEPKAALSKSFTAARPPKPKSSLVKSFSAVDVRMRSASSVTVFSFFAALRQGVLVIHGGDIDDVNRKYFECTDEEVKWK